MSTNNMIKCKQLKYHASGFATLIEYVSDCSRSFNKNQMNTITRLKIKQCCTTRRTTQYRT